MKGYIYTMFKGADPGLGWQMTDPIFKPVPTMGTCMPNIRRAVVPGDHIFVISGRTEGVRQYIVGGFEVAEKIHALAAYERFPSNRQHIRPDGTIGGNVIVQSDGSQSQIDYHNNFAARVENYIIGQNPIVIEEPHEIITARDETAEVLAEVFNRTGETPYDIIGRWRHLNESQIKQIRTWMRNLKQKPSC